MSFIREIVDYIKKNIDGIFAVVVILISGISFAYLTNPSFDVKEIMELKSKDVLVTATEGTINTLNNVARNVYEKDNKIRVTVEESSDDDLIFEEFINGDLDIVVTTRLINDKEKKLAAANDIQYREFVFGYVKVEDGEYVYDEDYEDYVYVPAENYLVMMYVNKNKYNKEATKAFVKEYYQNWYGVVDEDTLGPLFKEIYGEIAYYLELLEIYPD